METKNTSACVNNNVPNISIDAELVLIFNQNGDDRERAHMKKLLDAKMAEYPELSEPISVIVEMLGL